MREGLHTRLVATLLLVVLTGTGIAAAGNAVQISPYPVAGGQPVTVKYDPTDRVLDGASQVYLHYGFNGWSAVPPDVPMSWNAGAAVWQATVAVAANAGQLDVVFHNGSGTWDNNDQGDWHAFAVGGERWVVDGVRDEEATLVAQNNGRQLYAGVRGATLYIAAPGASGGYDSFIFVAGAPGALRNAPWAKQGRVAGWSAYIGNECDSGWAGWFDAAGAGEVGGGTWLEGTLDLQLEFGSVPGTIYLAFGPYETPDGGGLQFQSQVPVSTDNDGNLEANEYVQVSISAITIGCSPLDLDLDCDVDGGDFLAFGGCLLGPEVDSCLNARLDADNDVDLVDALRFQAAFGATIVPDAIVAEDLGPGATRFYPADVNLADLPPSLALETTPAVFGPAAQPWAIQPQFFEAGGRRVVWIPLADDVDLYGTGEICGTLRRNGHTTTAWNTDAYGYGPGNPSLYQSHPWVLAVRPDGTAFGVLADTTQRCLIDLSTDVLFAAEGAAFPIYLFEGDTPQDVLVRLADFIGRMELPPLWALGYQQSRYSYAPESVAREIAAEFRQRDIPCDVLWFDIDYMNEYRIFTFHPTGFPDPLDLNSDLHALGFHTVWMIDPGTKAEPGYFVYDQGSAGDHWVYTAAGEWYTGAVWPGFCHFPDFTRPQTRAWWSGLYDDFMAQGVDGVWNDMNEPGIFDGPNHSMPIDCWHRGGGGLPAGPHSQYHNVYGMLMAQATREGVVAANPQKRPFVLSRANFIGGQRYAAMWTGDNIASWDHLYHATPMVLNIGLSGQPFAGPDLGGFGGDAWGDLFARWMGVGVFMPFCRTHYDGQGVNQEPWSFGLAVEAECRTAIQRRYRLMPYLYTLFREASTSGLPVARPVYFADPSDATLRNEDVAFLLGADLLVVPNVSENPGAAPTPHVPGGIWRSFALVGENSAADVNQPDLRVRGGAIVPLGPVMEYTGQTALNPLTLAVCLDAGGFAEGWLYEDAGEGYAYRAGEYRLARYTATRVGQAVTIAVTDISGMMATPNRQVNIEILTNTGVVAGQGLDNDGGTITVIVVP